MNQIDSLVEMCIKKGYITSDQAPWLHYGIEKHFTTLLVSIPMVIIGCLISSPTMSLSFFISFYSLRKRTSGIHAKTPTGCFIGSILGEIFFLGILSRIWSSTLTCFFLITSAISIFFLAPYNHPKMNFTSEELTRYARSARKQLIILLLIIFVLYKLQYIHSAMGISLGIVMVAVTLTFAYLQKGGKNYEKANPCH